MAGLLHSAVFYDDEPTLLDQLVDDVEQGLDECQAVLVCLDDLTLATLGTRLQPGAIKEISWLSARVGYRRPINAMAAMWEFTQTAIRDGASGARVIGEIGLDGGVEDAPWHWYEAAVNEVFADVPLTARCLVDTSTAPDDTVAMLRCSHPVHLDLGAAPTQPCHDGPVPSRPRVHMEVTDGPPAFVTHLDDVSEVPRLRARVRALTADLDGSFHWRAELVVTELVTNAITYGKRAEVSVWREGDDGLVVRVVDHGPGIGDPFEGLRPPNLPDQGAGLWLTHLQSTELDIDTVPGRTAITSYLSATAEGQVAVGL